MNSFLQQLKGYGSKAARPYIQGTIDTVTNPKTYERLAKDAEALLGRNLPPQFSGANFSNIPMNAIGLLNKLPFISGPQRAIQSGMVSRTIDEMAGIMPRIARSTSQTAEGALRAPSIGQQVVRPITTYGPSNITQSFDPFMRDYGLTRELMRRAGGNMSDVAASLLPKQGFNPIGNVGGLIQNLNKTTNPLFQKIQGTYENLQTRIPTALNPLTTQNPTTTLGRVGKFFNPLNPSNFRDMLGVLAISTILSENDPNKGNVELAAVTPGGLIPKIAALGLLGATPIGTGSELRSHLSEAEQARLYGKYKLKNNLDPNKPKNNLNTGTPPPPVEQKVIPPLNNINIGIGTSDQRRAIEERNYQNQLNNIRQQALNPMSPDFQGYPNELAAQYGLEQAYGQELKQAGTLIPQLQEVGAEGSIAPKDFAAWANANPGLAVRLLRQLQEN
jgi:hypothetical protein